MGFEVQASPYGKLTPLSTQTFGNGTVVKRYLESHMCLGRLKNGNIKQVNFASNSPMKIAGIDTAVLSEWKGSPIGKILELYKGDKRIAMEILQDGGAENLRALLKGLKHLK